MAETKKKGRLFDLPETKGAFQLKGVVFGMEKDTAFKEIKTKSGKPMRMLNFGTSYLDGETLYVNLQGMEQEILRVRQLMTRKFLQILMLVRKLKRI